MAQEKPIFTYSEALTTFPQVEELTGNAVKQVDALFNRIQSRKEMDDRREEIETSYQEIVKVWASEVSALGCEVKGLWLVDWDSGDGYYCWRYPEGSIGYFHGYEEGFKGRVPIA